MICDRCFQPLEQGEHGQYKCPYEPRPSGGAVIDDSIPGGLVIRHGLCNEDGTPRRYDSKSEIALEAKRRGMVNYVRHQPPKGTDKSRHTSRWV